MFFDRNYSPEDIRRHCGSMRQIAHIMSFDLRDGRERGVHCLHFRTGSGLNFTVVPSRCMDIAFCDYKGLNLVWQSPTTIAAPEFYEPGDTGWLRGFFGGLLTTCGLVNVGPPDEWQGERYGIHGRIGHTPASHISHDAFWAGDDYYLLARGEMREGRPFGPNLVLRRRIQAQAGQRHFSIHDTVVNEGHQPTPLQILYHVNAGFPLVSAESRLLAPTKALTPRDDDAAEGLAEHCLCQPPERGFREQVFYHDLALCTDNRAWAALVNPKLGTDGIGLYIKYRTENLPHMTQWKMMGEGMYVVGLEPSNSCGIGFERGREINRLRMIEPGEEVDFHLDIGVLDGSREIEEFEQAIHLASPGKPRYNPPLL